MKYSCFHLVLMVTHRCNLHCEYCYMGRHFSRSMKRETGEAAIRRAIRSVAPAGTGTGHVYGRADRINLGC